LCVVVVWVQRRKVELERWRHSDHGRVRERCNIGGTLEKREREVVTAATAAVFL
jgi:hypothetical protein